MTARRSGDVVYESTLHNCRDVARAEQHGVRVALTIDGVTDDDASACFDPSSPAWILHLVVDGDETLLAPR